VQMYSCMHATTTTTNNNKGNVTPLKVAQRVGRGIALLFHGRGTRRG